MRTIKMITTETNADDEVMDAGSTQEINDASAAFWVRNGRAGYVETETKKRKKAGPTDEELSAAADAAEKAAKEKEASDKMAAENKSINPKS